MPEEPRIKAKFTNTKGEKVTSFTDGSKQRISTTGENITTPTPTTTEKPKGAPVISATDIGKTTEPQMPPMDTTNTGAERIGASMVTQTEGKAKRDDLLAGMISNIEALGQKGTRETALGEQYALEEKQRKVNQYDAEISQSSRFYDNKIRDLQERGGGLAMGAEAEIKRLELDKARKVADLSIAKAVALDDLETAQQFVQDKLDAEFEPIEKQIEYAEKVYGLYQNDLSESEQLEVQSKIEERKTNLDVARTTASDIVSELVSAGAYTAERQRIINQALREATTAIENGEDPTNAIGKMQSALVGVQSLQQQQMALQWAQENRIASEEEVETYSGEYANVVDIASGLVGSERGKTIKTGIVTALKNGDIATGYALIGNAVEESLTGENKTKFANARTDYQVMLGMKNAIQAYADAGGDMGFLKGTSSEITRKLGQLTTDPQFAELAIQLQREFQAYRQNMTGAAFGKGESAEYESVNPRSSASIDLNLLTIDGALNQLENRITSTINTRVPGANKLYSSLSGQVDETTLSDDEAYDLYLKMTGTVENLR